MRTALQRVGGAAAAPGSRPTVTVERVVLVLDEPWSGLDLIVRRDIFGAVIRTIAHEGRTKCGDERLQASSRIACSR